MKVLIGFNGSDAAKAALDELDLAGLPRYVEVLLLTVAESWLPPHTIAEATEMGNLGLQTLAENTSNFFRPRTGLNGLSRNRIAGLRRKVSPGPDHRRG